MLCFIPCVSPSHLLVSTYRTTPIEREVLLMNLGTFCLARFTIKVPFASGIAQPPNYAQTQEHVFSSGTIRRTIVFYICISYFFIQFLAGSQRPSKDPRGVDGRTSTSNDPRSLGSPPSFEASSAVDNSTSPVVAPVPAWMRVTSGHKWG